MEKSAHLFLENQLCFPIYATSRLIIRLYKPYLTEIGLTYPQYLVMMVLWKEDSIKVSDIGEQLLLNTNTVTPLLKTMKQKGLLQKIKSTTDERVTVIELTQTGQDLKHQAAEIPQKMQADSQIPNEELEQLRTGMWKMLKYLQE